MHILFLNPYHGGSHAAVAEGYAHHSLHHITLFSLPTNAGWRWRMRGAAVTMARLAREQSVQPDLILTTDMLDLATFRALTRDLYEPHIPAVLYFHENQLTYPLPPGREHDQSFAWINYTSALVADAISFNSDFHRRSFLAALHDLLSRYHDYCELDRVDAIAGKAHILAPGIDLARHDLVSPQHYDAHPPILLWNSRWEYDKQPQAFFDALEALAARGARFGLIIAGEHINPKAAEFVTARTRWSDRIIHWGYAADPLTYSRLLHQADIVVSTAIQEFFGIGVIEALYCGCIPILPRRLTYPDLLPAEYHADCLYDSQEELVERLYNALCHYDALRRRDWRSIAAPYDWSYMAPRYDQWLEDVVA